MKEEFKIYTEQLREGQEKKIEEKLSSDFLEIHEKDLKFNHFVNLKGVVYIAEKELILRLNIQTTAVIPCAICNEPVEVEINIENFYYSEPLENIKTGIFYFKDLLRETILLEVPPFAECNSGNCSHRRDVSKYLKQQIEEKETDDYHPFANLDWK